MKPARSEQNGPQPSPLEAAVTEWVQQQGLLTPTRDPRAPVTNGSQPVNSGRDAAP